MNYRMIAYILRYILCCEGLLLLLPFAVSLIYGESCWVAFLICIVLCVIIGFPFKLTRPKRAELHTKEGLVIVALSWITLSIIGALPFIISGVIRDPIDALFETVSGFTTTGATILSDVEVLPKSMLFWRSFTHWIGGMGVLVFILTVLPMSSGNHMNLMKAESPGPSVDKFAPKVKTNAKILYSIYIVLTLLQIVFLLIGKMPLFDAITTTFGTAGTGGFGVKNTSLAGYSVYNQVVVTIFMLLFGINFNFYFLLICKRFKRAFKNEEVLTYFVIIAAAIIIITIDIREIFGNIGMALQQSAFQVGSIITTTGFSTTDFNLWPQVSKTVLVILMFIGACAGSTGGGMKVSRLIILVKTVSKELHGYIHPGSVKKITLNGKQIPHEVVRTTNVFFVTYVLIFALSIFLVSFDGKDLVTTFTSVAATFNNIGPGLEIVGPAGNFSTFSAGAKLVLIFDMLAGRLELFPMLMLFSRHAWKKF